MAEVESVTKQSDELIEEGFATVNEGAAYLSMGRSWMYGEMDAGRLAYSHFGRSRRIPWAAIKRLARESLVGADSQD